MVMGELVVLIFAILQNASQSVIELPPSKTSEGAAH